MSTYSTTLKSTLAAKKARIVSISVMSPHDYSAEIATYDVGMTDPNVRLAQHLKLETTTLQNSIVVESYVYKTRSGNEHNRVVRLSVENMLVQMPRSFKDFILRRKNEITVLTGIARFNMPIGDAYVGYGFNTGTLIIHFPIDKSKSLKDNFLEFMKSEIV